MGRSAWPLGRYHITGVYLRHDFLYIIWSLPLPARPITTSARMPTPPSHHPVISVNVSAPFRAPEGRGVLRATATAHLPPQTHIYINTPDAPASLRGGASCIHGPWVGGLSLGPKIVGVGGWGLQLWGIEMVGAATHFYIRAGEQPALGLIRGTLCLRGYILGLLHGAD